MNVIRSIINSPLFYFLLGDGGILAIILTIYSLVKSNNAGETSETSTITIMPEIQNTFDLQNIINISETPKIENKSNEPNESEEEYILNFGDPNDPTDSYEHYEFGSDEYIERFYATLIEKDRGGEIHFE